MRTEGLQMPQTHRKCPHNRRTTWGAEIVVARPFASITAEQANARAVVAPPSVSTAAKGDAVAAPYVSTTYGA